jgi:ribosomal protein S6--L-glutamate ligase
LKIGFLVEKRYLGQAMPAPVIRAFRDRHIASDVICPEGCQFDPLTGVVRRDDGATFDLNRYDALVARNRNALGLAMLAYADAAGIVAINTHAATQRVRNKAKMAIALGRAGVPCAPTVLADTLPALATLPRAWFPLILKATYGDNSQGLRLIRRPEELHEVRWSETLVLAQQYLTNDGFDLKLYVCGRTVFAVRKPSPFNGNPTAPPQPVRPDARMRAIALRCGETFGLDIYGVDTVETAQGPAVIEVNEFPNFTGVPDAAACIADYILTQIRHRSGLGSTTRAHRVPYPAVGSARRPGRP